MGGGNGYNSYINSINSYGAPAFGGGKRAEVV
jgi:hypothetical protein